jgi:hypothetical protein
MLKLAVPALLAALIVTVAPKGAVAVSTARHCGHGYHLDKAGHCQPNHGGVNRFCAPGYVYQPAPGGWRCRPPHY